MLKKLPKILILSILAVFLVVGSALALPFNDRTSPVYVNPLGWDGLGNSLQEHLDLIYPAAGFDVENQDPAAIFIPSISGPTASSFMLLLEVAGFHNWNTFGIYSYADPNKMLTVFGGPNAPYNSEAVGFANGYVQIGSDSSTKINDFGTSFGFFLTTPQENIFYSEDDKNNDLAQMLIYSFPGTPNQYIVACEDLVLTDSDQDYNDLVVKASEVRPVPEPATMFLLGSGLIGLAAFGRKKFFKKS